MRSLVLALIWMLPSDLGVAGTVPEPEPELDVGGERVRLPVKLLAAEAREHFGPSASSSTLI